jgi:hypothetical protein
MQLNGWNATALDIAGQRCKNGPDNRCNADYKPAKDRLLTFLDGVTVGKCTGRSPINEQTGGVLAALPGCNPITWTEADARNVKC